MNLKLREIPRLLICLFLSTLVVSCDTAIPNLKVCSAAGSLSSGGICAETNTSRTSEITFDEFVDFLEASSQPTKGAAVCISSADFAKLKIALVKLCKAGKCKYSTTPVLGNDEDDIDTELTLR